jgi:hypothetical protein
MFAAVLTSIAELPQIGPVLLPYVHFGRLAWIPMQGTRPNSFNGAGP